MSPSYSDSREIDMPKPKLPPMNIVKPVVVKPVVVVKPMAVAKEAPKGAPKQTIGGDNPRAMNVPVIRKEPARPKELPKHSGAEKPRRQDLYMFDQYYTLPDGTVTKLPKRRVTY